MSCLSPNGNTPGFVFVTHAQYDKEEFFENLFLGYYIPSIDGTFLRHRALTQLEASPAVETSFVIRDQYFGGSIDNESTYAQVRREYIDNILESDYVLCVRGYGNFGVGIR